MWGVWACVLLFCECAFVCVCMHERMHVYVCMRAYMHACVYACFRHMSKVLRTTLAPAIKLQGFLFIDFSGVNSTFPTSGIFLINFLGVISTFCQNLEVGGRISRVAHLPGEVMTLQCDQTPVAIFTRHLLTSSLPLPTFWALQHGNQHLEHTQAQTQTDTHTHTLMHRHTHTHTCTDTHTHTHLNKGMGSEETFTMGTATDVGKCICRAYHLLQERQSHKDSLS